MRGVPARGISSLGVKGDRLWNFHFVVVATSQRRNVVVGDLLIILKAFGFCSYFKGKWVQRDFVIILKGFGFTSYFKGKWYVRSE